MTSQDPQNELEIVRQWIREYGINRFVTAQNRQALDGVPEEYIWSEYFSYDDDNSYAFDSMAPDTDEDETLLGFYIGEQPHGSSGDLAIMTEKAIPCDNPSCWSGDCAACGSTRVNGQINLYELAVAEKHDFGNERLENQNRSGIVARFCHSCGKEIGTEDMFCSGCGQKLPGRVSENSSLIESERESKNAELDYYPHSQAPARQDLVEAFLNAPLLDDQEPILEEIISAGDVYGLFSLGWHALQFGGQDEAEGYARQAISLATGNLLSESAQYYLDVILLNSGRYQEAEWVCRASFADTKLEISEWAINAVRKGLEAQGLPEPDLARLLDQIDPRQPTSGTETQERYRDVLIARFVFDHGAGDEQTVRAFDSKNTGHYLSSTLEFIDHWDYQYDWLRREVIASAVRNAAVLIDLGEASPWLRGGYLNP